MEDRVSCEENCQVYKALRSLHGGLCNVRDALTNGEAEEVDPARASIIDTAVARVAFNANELIASCERGPRAKKLGGFVCRAEFMFRI